MPEVMYKSNSKMMKKSFPYNSKGVMEAKNFAKMTGGKMKMSVNESRMKYAKKNIRIQKED